jgi:hypothetical protein
MPEEKVDKFKSRFIKNIKPNYNKVETLPSRMELPQPV